MSEINVYPRHKLVENLLELYPPQPINRFLPDWYKKQKVNNKEDFYFKDKAIQAKRCPAIIEEVTRGIVIPSWTDFFIYKKGDLINWVAEVGRRPELDHIKWITEQGEDQIEHMKLNGINSYGILKLTSPYLFKAPKGYGIHFKDPFYHHRRNIRLLSGYVESDIWYETNFPFEFYKDINVTEEESLVIKAGDPLIVMELYKKDQKHEVKVNKYDEEFIDLHTKQAQHLYSMSEDWNRYTKFYK
jgi:hypothetical protein